MKHVFKAGRQQQWEAIPPYQLLESTQTMTSHDPRAYSGLLGWNLVEQSTKY